MRFIVAIFLVLSVLMAFPVAAFAWPSDFHYLAAPALIVLLLIPIGAILFAIFK